MIVIPERVAQRAFDAWSLSPDRCLISTYSVASHGYSQIGWTDADGIHYGNTDFGACVFMDMIQWYSAGSYDEITPVQARLLAAFLLAAAESADMMNQEGAA